MAPLFNFSAQAQDSCDSILIWAAASTLEATDDASANSALYGQYCGVKAEKMDRTLRTRASLNIISTGNGNAGFDDATTNQKIDSWCDTHKQDVSSNSYNAIKARIIFEPSVSAWSACMQMQPEVRLTPSFYPHNSGATFNLSYSGHGKGLIFYGVTTKNFSCKTLAPKEGDGTTEISDEQVAKGVDLKNQSISITCDRADPRKEKRDGKDYDVWDEGHISVNTAGEFPLVFNFEKRFDPPLPKDADQIADIIDSLKNKIDINNKEIYVLRAMLVDAYKRTGGINYILAHDRESCPFGYKPSALLYLPAADEHNAKSGPFPYATIGIDGLSASTKLWTQQAYICEHE